jgi:predicted AAA+ superfamily ATPase
VAVSAEFTPAPREIGQKVKASVLAPDYRAAQVRGCIHLLAKARIVRLTYHSHADGIPLAAQIEEKIFKAYWVDVGLLWLMSGLSSSFSSLYETQIFKGKLTEKFVAQHLSDSSRAMDRQTLYYWLREGKSANAALDFVIQHNA